MSSHAAAGTIDHHHDPSTSTGIPNKKLMMWTFLASDCMFFGALISTHLIYRLHPAPGSPSPKQIFSLELTSFSTFILLMSSLMMALAVTAIQKGNVKSMRWSLLTTIFFGAIFLGCQVYEFEEFVKLKNVTLTNSMFGTTFYTLTGTHGIHVAVGVFWLILMYVRSFQPHEAGRTFSWLFKNCLHITAIVGAVLLSMFAVLGVVHTLQTGGTAGAYFASYLWMIVGFVGCVAVCIGFAQPKALSNFGEANAIDVESMGLYWHFVDIVWIVIFTAVYLIEYL
jgi:cytochrome o ubiquinol oxidase subunit 3